MSTPSIGFPRPGASAALDSARAAPPAKDAGPTQDAKASTQTNTTASTQRSHQNKQILQASMEVSIKSADSSLALLYRTAIDRINLELEPELGPNAIGSAPTTDLFTPEATAGRIVALSTAFYDAYAAQSKNKDLDSETLARNFVDLIRGGFERGFGEAQDILSGLGVLGADSPIEQGIKQTYALVMKGYDDFLAAKLNPGPAANTPPQDTSTALG
ncbi:MAG: DUF5610 domain-containing protein [Gammaproteobacteria bacterium]|uniref:DUF5610 domain-containing protein n=1 Tax=Rhodoferax sp. TaxID=50421 RepID=UPI001D2A42AF|nr:DUF5610 domain-containing protein [Rhodoferax sp.]MBU3898356.1 DUF5610 domain-containing protein [Gammaproteobacteria bacterium]MBU3996958.1 DUF5610 domain-containing protein [Gammaproteobacteria bacterium]MBU4019597.1 DUF5610 domain-containing protein [Gammaproteobacteria bacterium]MBU4079130.1 DUF5610 domain-containing protein [Gammaproteobacteria bacterium]MBU4111812.1 DUF5610 domain-containing protein [Gammaproteobacteria bacterium]